MANEGNCLMKPAQLTCPVIQGLGAYRVGQAKAPGAEISGVVSPIMGGGDAGSPVPPMPNLVKHTGNEAAADDVKSKTVKAAGNIVTHVDDLLGALAEMHEVNKFWKDKYMQVRTDHINKYVPTGNTRIQERMFLAWKGYVFQVGNVQRLQCLKTRLTELQEEGAEAMDAREIDHKATLKQMQATHETRLEEVARTIEEQNQQCQQVLREREYYEDREAGSAGLLKELRTLLENTSEQSYAVGKEQVKELAGDFEYARTFLHEILNEIDPKYVPPVGSLCVGATAVTNAMGVWQPAPQMKIPALQMVSCALKQGSLMDGVAKRKWLSGNEDK